MNEICGDNRFEIIAKAKEHLLDATNIDTSEDEMKVLDDFLFRCWQMGWLDRYDEPKDEPQTDDPTMDEYYKDHDEFYECDRHVITNDEGERAYNCIGCQTDCAWKKGE